MESGRTEMSIGVQRQNNTLENTNGPWQKLTYGDGGGMHPCPPSGYAPAYANTRNGIMSVYGSKVVFSERELKFMFAICHRPSVCLSSVCLSVVCNVGAPYSGVWNFRQCFYAMWYFGHPWPLYKNFTEIVPGEPLRRGVKPKRGSKI